MRPEDEPPADLALVDEQELELAKMLVEAQRAPFDPSELKDRYNERVLGLVNERARMAVPENVSDHDRQPAPVVDIKEALRKTLDAVRKPPKGEPAGRPGRKKDKRRTK